jgi:hypothetical protein
MNMAITPADAGGKPLLPDDIRESGGNPIIVSLAAAMEPELTKRMIASAADDVVHDIAHTEVPVALTQIPPLNRTELFRPRQRSRFAQA